MARPGPLYPTRSAGVPSTTTSYHCYQCRALEPFTDALGRLPWEVDPNRSLEEILDDLRRMFNDREIDRLLRQATIQQAEGAPADRDYLLQRVRTLYTADWEDARPIVVELLRVLAHLVASVETLWATVARLEQRLERLEEQDEGPWEE